MVFHLWADDARVVLHTLTLCLERGTSTLASAELNPPSVDILDLVDAAEGGRCTLGFVVRPSPSLFHNDSLLLLLPAYV